MNLTEEASEEKKTIQNEIYIALCVRSLARDLIYANDMLARTMCALLYHVCVRFASACMKCGIFILKLILIIFFFISFVHSFRSIDRSRILRVCMCFCGGCCCCHLKSFFSLVVYVNLFYLFDFFYSYFFP